MTLTRKELADVFRSEIRAIQTDPDPQAGLQRLEDLFDTLRDERMREWIHLRLAAKHWIDDFIEVFESLLVRFKSARKDADPRCSLRLLDWFQRIYRAPRFEDIDLMNERMMAKGFIETISSLFELNVVGSTEDKRQQNEVLHTLITFHIPFVSHLDLSIKAYCEHLKRGSSYSTETAALVITHLHGVTSDAEVKTFWYCVVDYMFEASSEVDALIVHVVSIDDAFARQMVHADVLAKLQSVFDEEVCPNKREETTKAFLNACAISARLTYYSGYLNDDVSYWMPLFRSFFRRLNIELNEEGNGILNPESAVCWSRTMVSLCCNPNLRPSIVEFDVQRIIMAMLTVLETIRSTSSHFEDIFNCALNVVRFTSSYSSKDNLKKLSDSIDARVKKQHVRDALCGLVDRFLHGDQGHVIGVSLCDEMKRGKWSARNIEYFLNLAGALDSPELEPFWNAKGVGMSVLSCCIGHSWITVKFGSFFRRLVAKLDVNERDDLGRTFLMTLVARNHLDRCESLLLIAILEDPRLDRNARDNQGQNAFDHAVRHLRRQFAFPVGRPVIDTLIDHDMASPRDFWAVIFPGSTNPTVEPWEGPADLMLEKAFSGIELLFRRTSVQLTFDVVRKFYKLYEMSLREIEMPSPTNVIRLEMMVHYLSRAVFLTTLCSSKSRVGRGSPLRLLPSDLFRRCAEYLPCFPPWKESSS